MDNKCIVCKMNEVNPMIGGIEGPFNKSFCSRICYDIYLTSAQHLISEQLKHLAQRAHAKDRARNIKRELK